MRKSRLALDRWHNGLMKDTLGKYRKAVVEELGDEKAGKCPMCERPYRTDRAFRAVEKALDRKLGSPQVQIQIMAVIQTELGCRDIAEARGLIAMAREAGSLDATAVVDISRKLLEAEGWTCLPPESAIEAKDGTNGHIAP